ncbi:ubiquinone biosynthesis O-methyltransferase [Gonapodya prolifera JEL478]|uniref:Ubiquinone biosynthesis O-methyltransferase, mitochondrial n=1 Tax=Gonapodya prolifera (strain JEL478) TaxID=1344416 RepID=A0A139A4N8_GONPJ|nr:ubiquinone biosynthesis O-methyltransferase [Gonapodya prolifera JEL478]|eukprot:KXS11741.1 ubiquinone biosynthesis O-methyltransferase [Gonapodya prolifera JEL478]
MSRRLIRTLGTSFSARNIRKDALSTHFSPAPHLSPSESPANPYRLHTIVVPNPSPTPPQPPTSTIDPSEVAKFSRLAESWWDPDGPSRLLHLMNGARVGWIRETVTRNMPERLVGRGLEGVRVLDVGCGGGFLSEALARLGAHVVGVDAARENVQVATAHALKDPSLRRADGTCLIDYRNTTAESLLDQGEKFDVVCAMEILEHVADAAHFIQMCSGLLKPSSLLLVSTISRTPLSYLVTVLLAEHLLRFVEPGTHDYEKYCTPEELTGMMAKAGVMEVERRGVMWNPIAGRWEVGDGSAWTTGANYFMAGKSDELGV